MDAPVASGSTVPRVARPPRERELERKRARGEASCAECRRLKLKCDKKAPCSSCLRRGCSGICPNGSLATGQGSRYVLANTDKLHGKLLEMSKRIRQLEDALRIAQLSLTTTPHPLLSSELLSIKMGVDVEEDTENDVADSEILPNIGTLTITEHGETRFLGRTGAEAIMETVVRDIPLNSRKQSLSSLPSEIAYLSESFPFSALHMQKREILQLILARLPPYERATALVEAYLAHLSCFFRPVQRAQIMEELLPRYYKHKEKAVLEDEKGVSVHELALLLAVLASGAAGDLTQEALNEEGELYRHLSRCALSLHNIFEGTSTATVQALSLVGAYDFFSANAETLEMSWKMLSLTMCLASSIGLHWDPSSWNLPEKHAERRRSVFWELYTLDKWKSLGSGRPPIFRPHEVDCKFPEDPEGITSKDGQILHGFYHWKYDFAKQVTSSVASKLCTVSLMKYSEIMELDRKVREHPGFSSEYLDKLDAGGSSEKFQALAVTLYREISLIFIHRNFFAKALRENPTNPIRSRFGPSFLAAYASAITLLRAMRRNYESCRRALLLFWSHALASGVIVGSVAARDTSELARTAMKDLELAIGLFESAAQHPVSKNGLPILLRLRDKARSNFERAESPLIMMTEPERVPSSPSTVTMRVEPIDEALSLLGGETKYVKRMRKSLGYPSVDAMSTPSTATDAASSSPSNTTNQVIKNIADDAQELFPPLEAGMQPDSVATLGLDLGDVYNWLYSQLVDRAPVGGSYDHNQIAFANALSMAPFTAGSNGAPAMPSVQQQPPEVGLDADRDGLASWGLQTVVDFQGTSTAAPGSFNPSSLQTRPEVSSVISNHSAGAIYTNGLSASGASEADGLSMTIENPLGYDFEIGDGMAVYGELGAYSQLGTGDDTIENAWRTIMEDPRFAPIEPNSLFPFSL